MPEPEGQRLVPEGIGLARLGCGEEAGEQVGLEGGNGNLESEPRFIPLGAVVGYAVAHVGEAVPFPVDVRNVADTSIDGDLSVFLGEEGELLEESFHLEAFFSPDDLMDLSGGHDDHMVFDQIRDSGEGDGEAFVADVGFERCFDVSMFHITTPCHI